MPPSRRTNRLRERLAGGGPLIGFLPHVQTPEFIEYCGLLGFDWAFLDAEHTGLSAERCQDLVRAADVVGLPSVIRLPMNEPAVILPYLETGADAVIAPHVDDAAAARRLVQACRYFPKGIRGSSAGSRAANFGLTQPASEYFSASQDQAIPIPLLEDRKAFESLAEIAAVDEVEMLFLGPGDLAMSLGLGGNSRHPQVQQQIANALAYLVKAGKVVGTIASSPDDVRRLAAAGARLLLVGTGGLFAPAARQFLEAARADQPA